MNQIEQFTYEEYICEPQPEVIELIDIQNEEKFQEFSVMDLKAIMIDPRSSHSWLNVLKDQAFTLWLRLLSLSISVKGFKALNNYVTKKAVAAQLNISTSKFDRNIKVLYNYGLVDILVVEGSENYTKKGNTTRTYRVYPYPNNDPALANQPLVQVRDYDSLEEFSTNKARVYGLMGATKKQLDQYYLDLEAPVPANEFVTEQMFWNEEDYAPERPDTNIVSFEIKEGHTMSASKSESSKIEAKVVDNVNNSTYMSESINLTVACKNDSPLMQNIQSEILCDSAQTLDISAFEAIHSIHEIDENEAFNLDQPSDMQAYSYTNISVLPSVINNIKENSNTVKTTSLTESPKSFNNVFELKTTNNSYKFDTEFYIPAIVEPIVNQLRFSSSSFLLSEEEITSLKNYLLNAFNNYHFAPFAIKKILNDLEIPQNLSIKKIQEIFIEQLEHMLYKNTTEKPVMDPYTYFMNGITSKFGNALMALKKEEENNLIHAIQTAYKDHNFTVQFDKQSLTFTGFVKEKIYNWLDGDSVAIKKINEKNVTFYNWLKEREDENGKTYFVN